MFIYVICTAEDKGVASMPEEKVRNVRINRSDKKFGSDPSVMARRVKDMRTLRPNQSSKMIDSMTEQDIKNGIRALMANVSIVDGLDSESEWLFMALLSEFAERDEKGMMEWVTRECNSMTADSIIVDRLRRKFQKKQPDNRQEFFEKGGELLSSDGRAALAGSMMLNTKDISTEDALFFLGHLSVGRSAISGNMGFADQFDFRTFAGSLVSMVSNIENSQNTLSAIPNNLLTEWVKRDPEEAFEFYQEYLYKKPYSILGNGYPEMIQGYVNSATEEQASSWLNDVLESTDLTDNEYSEVIDKLTRQEFGGVGFNEALLNKSSNRDVLMAEIAGAALRYSDAADRLGKSIQSFTSFDHYLESAMKAILGDSPIYSSEGRLINVLREMGRKEAEIEYVKSIYQEAKEIKLGR
ncbi:hypothetical protein ACFSQZ_06705 [Rubritalea spongiae]|uniref:Uncharacterized protein n=2 Tax=Rubritalea spongiae TaxID=430797 RepID=A0ABW5E3C0_9BACT